MPNTVTRMVRLSLTLIAAALLQIGTPAPVVLSISLPTGLSLSPKTDLAAPTGLPKFAPEDAQKSILPDLTVSAGPDAQHSHPAGASAPPNLPAALRWFRWLPFENINL
ncbi:hypothetical protein F4861DRAFT_127612 [Xylaria intraflava]|nr:hypothetical protein F4861DRAFT_127612 [Xylaria intraflava]